MLVWLPNRERICAQNDAPLCDEGWKADARGRKCQTKEDTAATSDKILVCSFHSIVHTYSELFSLFCSTAVHSHSSLEHDQIARGEIEEHEGPEGRNVISWRSHLQDLLRCLHDRVPNLHRLFGILMIHTKRVISVKTGRS